MIMVMIEWQWSSVSHFQSIPTCRDSASIDILGSFRQLSFSTVVCWLRNDNDDVCVSIWSVHFLVQYLLVIT